MVDMERALAEPRHEIIQNRRLFVVSDRLDRSVPSVPDFPGNAAFVGHSSRVRAESNPLDRSPDNDVDRGHNPHPPDYGAKRSAGHAEPIPFSLVGLTRL